MYHLVTNSAAKHVDLMLDIVTSILPFLTTSCVFASVDSAAVLLT